MNNIKEKKEAVYDSFNGNATVTKRYPVEVTSLSIANDGVDDVELDLGYCKVTIKPDEVFDDSIVPQRSFTINASNKFRCIVRGEY